MRRVLLLAVLAALAVAAVPAARAAAPPPLPDAATVAAARAGFLGNAGAGIAALDAQWWAPEYGWYRSRPQATGAQPLPALWYAFPLFEAKAALALAQPTAANKAAVDAFARQAENYWDPTIADGHGGFSWYYGLRGTGNAFFDDNGWWGLAYVDAYRATGTKRWLWDADRALGFIDRYGWDAKNGGVWWDLAHDQKTSEPLAAGALIAADLYGITKKLAYLKLAKKYIAWADAHTRNPAQGMLYGRNATDGTVMDYVEGMMAAAHVELCAATGVKQYCARAEQIADASSDQFPILADWSPETDVVYLRALAELYAHDRNPRWYAVVYANASRAAANARDENGLWSKRWDGGWTLPGAIYTQAATAELFAWMAGMTPPS